jgi:hypothetical protein
MARSHQTTLQLVETLLDVYSMIQKDWNYT